MINKTKILLIRFSSFGDVVQCLSLPSVLKNRFPNSEIHFLTKTDFTGLIETHPAVNRVWELNKEQGFKGLLELIQKLRAEKFSLIYDSHNNLRSHFVVWGLHRLLAFSNRPKIIRRSIMRWKRFLLFNFRINLFQQPFSGQRDLIAPLQEWGITSKLPAAPQIFIKEKVKSKVQELIKINFSKSHYGNDSNCDNVNRGFYNNTFICLAPSAAHKLKKWPKEYWQELVNKWNISFIILGGPKDDFLAEIAAVAPNRILNFAGKLSLEESAAVIASSQLLITNDTGLLHVAEQLGHPAVALMGPAPFGFPSRYESTLIIEKNLSCKPCSKHGQGPCRNSNFHECLRGITPDFVLASSQQWLIKLGIKLKQGLA
jgi:ADP-heptose:LPS heptosyltransferase